jgi:hypothetical protein
MRLYLLHPMIIAATAAASGCIDLVPNHVARDAGTDIDMGADDGGGAADGAEAGRSACLTCLAAPMDPGPGCADAWDSCITDPRCQAVIECSDEIGCFASGTTGAYISCVGPCAAKYQILGNTDPSFPAISRVVLCGTNTGSCARTCSGQ